MNDRSFIADLKTTAPVHVGSGEVGSATDLPLLRDPDGWPYIPGTHIAGRLREIATRLAPALGWKACVALDPERGTPDKPCACQVCQVFGDRRPSEEAGDEPRASLVWCFDSPLVKQDGVRAIVRDGVGIDRRTGSSAAKAGALYDAEWIPAGTTFRLRVEIEHGAEDLAEQVLALALSEWTEGRGRIGGGAARGGGAFELRGEQFRRVDLVSPEDLIEFLGTREPEQRGREDTDWVKRRVAEVRPSAETAAVELLPVGAVGSYASLSFDLAFDGPLLVNDPAVALAHGVSFAPVFAGSDWEKPVLPGSSVRGVLRAQAERIARTVSARKAGGLAAFAAACAACDPFATTKTRDKAEEKEDALRSCADRADVRERRTGEEISFEDEAKERCLGCTLFGSTRQGSRLWIADAELSGDARFRLRDFVAIDRFTGGALEGAKFDALPLYSPTFRIHLLLWEPGEWELGALALALRDVHDGLATLGAHGSRGFGRAAVQGVRLSIGRLGNRGPVLPTEVEPEDEPRGEPATSGVFTVGEWEGGGDAATFAELAHRQKWTAAFLDACVLTRRELPSDGQLRDAYFGVTTEDGVRMEDLYPLAVNLDELEAAHAGS